ncbi:DUF1003 domain-containing protein [Dyadobacter sediminis]|uniref:DUF1003 domain-containing protein n=1 Tax=Dyadobacter sediminis TaxID=1493691 RepID=A0A5R9KJ21_9BACT|nr:DUF1003 domain-containing protein [Dyadobacter sediminis]TLU96119.1 DUF1003 domain-containing protein [Dyadobacter sediminis]GGB79428.1 hypothetical protein GCM10011325_03700 [Dyadobacter sediminis]
MKDINNKEAAPGTGPEMGVVVRNIHALMERSLEEERQKTWKDRIADTITSFTGSMQFVYIHLVIFSIWIIWNLEWLGLKPFDPSFVVLAMFASVEAIFLSTFVLISQNRMNAQADKRADLNLQVNLLAEHEITRLIQLVTAMAKKMDIAEANDAEIDFLAKDVQPEKVLDTMESYNRKTLDMKESEK